MVLDNSATAMTGFQPHPATGITAMGDQVPPMDIQKMVEGIGCKAEVADPFDVLVLEPDSGEEDVRYSKFDMKAGGDRRKFCVIDVLRQYENLRLSQE